MLPLRDNIPSKSYPLVSWAIIGVCASVFLYELSLEPADLVRFVSAWGMTPARLHLFSPQVLVSNPEPLLTLVTSPFLHGGWFHLLTNMWILFIFGDNVEDRLGKAGFLFFYLLSGAAANLFQALFYQTAGLPVIGASGAIAGVLGAYFICFPAARVLSLIPVFIFPWLVEIPAIFYLGFWFISQLYSGFLSLGSEIVGVAWWAHIGGFLFGILVARFFIRGVRRTSPWYPAG